MAGEDVDLMNEIENSVDKNQNFPEDIEKLSPSDFKK